MLESGTEAVMDFKDLLVKQGFPLDKVMIMRHRPREPELRRELPWLAADQPELFNAYQQAQSPQAEKALAKADFVASFIAMEGDQAVFVGLYRRRGWRPVTPEQFWAIPEISQLKKHYHMRGPAENRKSLLWFDLELLDFYGKWKGRLVVQWPPGRLWWRWAKSKNSHFPVHAIHEEDWLGGRIDPWDRLSLTWDSLQVLPMKWKAALREWRGIYYIFDVKQRKGYVGSAGGQDNILGRWLGYAASGHCGNKKLKQLNPRNFVFTILQRTSPDLEQKELLRLEESWKVRLHTREYGLNEN